MIRQIKNLLSALSLRTHLSGGIKFNGLPKHFHRTLPQIFIFLFLLIFLSFSCNTNEPPKDNGAITLSVEDASCIEAWIILKVENITLPAAVTLKQSENNGEEKVRQIINLTTADTLLFIDSLLPKRSYKFKAEWINKSGELKTAEATTVTMDTTSHNFTFETFTFGQHSSSTLYDVAIINENNIWAVGEIYMNDSLGNPDPKRFNAVRWDGIEWKVERIPYNYQGAPFYHPIQSVFAFNENDVWFCGNGIIHWDGSNYLPISIPTSVWGQYQMNKLWGSSSNDLYVVGNGGNIAHWDGISWKKIESGTGLDFYDIYAANKKINVETEIYAVAAKQFFSFEKKIFRIIESDVLQIATENIANSLHGFWFKAKRKYYAVGSGFYTKQEINNNEEWKELHIGISNYYIYGIRGLELNNIFLCGAFGELLHFNGYDWRSFINEIGINSGSYKAVQIHGNIIVVVGYDQPKSKIALGRR